MHNNHTTYIAKTFSGLEDVLAGELRSLGAHDVQQLRRGVSFTGDLQLLYRINIRCRTALNILQHLGSFGFDSRDAFYDQMRTIAWQDLFQPDKTIAVHAIANDSPVFNNTLYLAQLTKDAIVDHFREHTGDRPAVDTEHAQARIVVNVHGNRCLVSLNTSGEPLFKRGYRRAGGQAPLNEVLAAGLIALSGWDKKSLLIDPMCGSGTVAIEAAMMAAEMAPGLDRKTFGFSHLLSYDDNLFQQEKESARNLQKPLQATIIASDIRGGALDNTRQNTMNAGFMGSIRIQRNDFFTYTPPDKEGWLLMNPPYGERMKLRDAKELYTRIGDTLKQRYAGYQAGIISSELNAIKNIGLKPRQKFPVYNGPLPCTFNIYELFKGNHKEKKATEA